MDGGQSMISAWGKWASLALSVLAAAVLGTLLVHRARRSAPHYEMIDNSAQLDAFLGEPASSAGTVGPDGLLELDRKPWTREQAKHFYPALGKRKLVLYDEHLGLRLRPGLELSRQLEEHPDGGFVVRTNAHGLREDEQVAEQVDLRLLVAGDSQTEGVCTQADSFTNRLERLLRDQHSRQRIDALNAGLGGTNPWYYLATLERSRDLAPDIFLPVFYGGNDFSGVMPLERWYHDRGRPQRSQVEQLQQTLAEISPGLAGVQIAQLLYFLANPDDREIALAVWVSLSVEMQQQCAERGIEFLPVYLPPPLCAQPELYAALRARTVERLPQLAAEIGASDELADRWIAELGRREIQVIDLRPALRADSERLFWESGLHLNLTGNEVVAAALAEALSRRVTALLER